ncbi:MAG: hypothetical protein ACOC3D_08570 [Pseudomonadota bacterium]
MHRLLVIVLALGIMAALAAPVRALPDHRGVELVFGDLALERIDAAFERFDPDHRQERAARRARFDALGHQLFARERAGADLACSRQIFVEAKWLIGYTAWWERIDRRLAELELSLDEPDQAFARDPVPADGLYGVCAEERFVRIETTLEAYFQLADEGALPPVMRTPQPWARSPDALIAFLNERLVSDIEGTGEDMRSRVGGLTSIMMATAKRDHVLDLLRRTTSGEPLTRGEQRAVRTALHAYVDAWQDPQTGYWGAWYRDADGRLFKTTDLSITYHIVHALRGEVRFWPQLIETTLALRDHAYPFGWLSRGRWTNHNNYDLVRIFRYGWPYMTAEQQAEVADLLQRMVDWAFRVGIEQDYEGFVLVPELSSSVGAELYFGVSFLDAAGYFALDPWTGGLDYPAPRSEVCAALWEHAHDLAEDAYVLGAKQKLRRACADHLPPAAWTAGGAGSEDHEHERQDDAEEHEQRTSEDVRLTHVVTQPLGIHRESPALTAQGE